MTAHVCGGCGRYTAVVNGRAMDYRADRFTPSDRPHSCGPNGLLHVEKAERERCKWCEDGMRIICGHYDGDVVLPPAMLNTTQEDQ